MQLIKPSYEIMTPLDREEVLKYLELCGRVAYKSEDRITEDSASKFVSTIVKNHHLSVIEHVSMTVRFIVDRGVSHEMVRHRLCSFTQESTRYVRSATIEKLTVDDDVDVVEFYENGFSMREVSEKSNGRFNEWDVYKILEENSIPRRNLGNRGLTYHNYFDVIDTSEKAYLLGIIMADGCVRPTHNSLSITQHKDIVWYLALMVRQFIRPGVKLVKDRDCNQLTIISEQIVKSLISKGIVPNKSLEFNATCAELLWSSLPEELIPSFLRGYMDGDGHIRFYKQENKGRTFSCNLGWSGPAALLEKIRGWLEYNYEYSPTIIQTSSACLSRLNVTKPEVGLLLCQDMLKDFKFPFGNPNKTPRMCEHINYTPKFAEFGDPKFKVIIPPWFDISPSDWVWLQALDNCEVNYGQLLQDGWTPQQARSVLPNSLKTEIIVTANLREWKHIFDMRCATGAHPQMREVMVPLRDEMIGLLPEIFT